MKQGKVVQEGIQNLIAVVTTPNNGGLSIKRMNNQAEGRNEGERLYSRIYYQNSLRVRDSKKID